MAQLDNPENRQPAGDRNGPSPPLATEVTSARQNNQKFAPHDSPNPLSSDFPAKDKLLSQLGINNKLNPFSTEITDIRKDLAKHFGVDKLEALTPKGFAEHVEHTVIKNANSEQLDLMNTSDSSIFLVGKGNKVFTLNLKDHSLDSGVDLSQPGLKSYMTEDLSPEKREEFQHQLLTAKMALTTLASDVAKNNPKLSEKCFQAIESMYGQALDSKLISKPQFARTLASTGNDSYVYNHDTKGLDMQKRALSLLTKDLGAANIETLDERSHLINN